MKICKKCGRYHLADGSICPKCWPKNFKEQALFVPVYPVAEDDYSEESNANSVFNDSDD